MTSQVLGSLALLVQKYKYYRKRRGHSVQESGGASFVDTFVTPREAPHADGNVLAEQVD